MKPLTQNQLVEQFTSLGVSAGDFILVRAALGSVGRMAGGATTFIDALLQAVGSSGTVASLAFTGSPFIRRPQVENAFTTTSKSYAGALPNAMLAHSHQFRSRHPTCSYVAIGKDAEAFTLGHDATSPAYEPIRKIVLAGGKCMLIGCVASSPGFTTAHLAEADLGLQARMIFPWLNSTYYIDDNGQTKLFRRYDPGLCSMSFYKFYAHYVSAGILRTGHIGNAYSILAPAAGAYEIEKSILSKNAKFNVCDSPDCFTCNGRRWDRLHRAPGFFARMVYRAVSAQRPR